VVIEGDSSEAEAEIMELGGGTARRAPTRERRPGRGRAYLFRTPRAVVLSDRTKLGRSGAIDVRGPGGILVLPPSVHLTGHEYTWVKGRAPWEVDAPLLPSRLLELVRRSGVVSARGASSQQGSKLAFAEGGRVLSPRVQFLLRSRRLLNDLWTSVGKRHGDTSASGYDFALARELLRCGVPEEDVVRAIAARPRAHRKDRDYCRATVRSAGAKLGGRR